MSDASCLTGTVSRQDRTAEEKIARLATVQKGVVTWAELRRADVSENEIRWRTKAGALIREYPGVYRVGHRAPSFEATYLAAVKACGERAVLCGRAAAYLQGLLPLTREPPPPEVMCPTERRIGGIDTRRCRRIHPLDVAEYRGIPITTVPRTLLDLASLVEDDVLARAAHEAGVRHRTGPTHVQAVLDRHPRARGAPKLRRVVSGETPVTLSVLEREFLKLLDCEGIERPSEVNRRVGSKRIDCRWPEHQLTVELDSFRFHNSRYSWEEDRLREREAHARKERHRRYTWADVIEDPRVMLQELRELTCGRSPTRCTRRK